MHSASQPRGPEPASGRPDRGSGTPPTVLHYRPVASSDETFLLELFAGARPELALLPEHAREQLVRMQVQAQRRQYAEAYPEAEDRIVDLPSGEPVGRCWTWQSTSEHRLIDLVVRERYRRRGIAAAVLADLCDRADTAGLPLRLSVWHDNSPARQLYEGRQFTVTGEHNGYLEMQRPVPDVRIPPDEENNEVMDFAIFSARVGTEFVSESSDGGRFRLTLRECSPTGPDGAQNSFSLRFKAEPGTPIEQATYLLSADGFGPEALFLVPVSDAPDGPEFQAVFNRPPG